VSCFATTNHSFNLFTLGTTQQQELREGV